MSRKQDLDQIRALFEIQQLAVLATQKNDQPYASLIVFAATSDLKTIIFLTPDTTRKYEHLVNNPKVAVLIHNAGNQVKSLYTAVSVTATGLAEVMTDERKESFRKLFLDRHPHLGNFSTLPTTAMVGISVDRYVLVNEFQKVVEIPMGS